MFKSQCDHGLVRLGYKHHLIRVWKRSCFGLKSLFCHQRQHEDICVCPDFAFNFWSIVPSLPQVAHEIECAQYFVCAGTLTNEMTWKLGHEPVRWTYTWCAETLIANILSWRLDSQFCFTKFGDTSASAPLYILLVTQIVYEHPNM